MHIVPSAAAAAHVEAAVFIDHAAVRRGELLRQAGVERWSLHRLGIPRVRRTARGHWSQLRTRASASPERSSFSVRTSFPPSMYTATTPSAVGRSSRRFSRASRRKVELSHATCTFVRIANPTRVACFSSSAVNGPLRSASACGAAAKVAARLLSRVLRARSASSRACSLDSRLLRLFSRLSRKLMLLSRYDSRVAELRSRVKETRDGLLRLH